MALGGGGAVLRRAVTSCAGSVDADRLAAVVGGVALAVAAVGWATRRSWLDNLGRRADLTGRLDLWNVALDWAWRRPLHGYGYMARVARSRRSWPRSRRPGARCSDSAHNSFVDMFLGAGLIGLALASGSSPSCTGGRCPTRCAAVGVATLFPVALLVFVVVENLTETLFVGNQLIVALLGSLLWPRPEPLSEITVSDEAVVPVDEGSGVLGGPAELWRVGPRPGP